MWLWGYKIGSEDSCDFEQVRGFLLKLVTFIVVAREYSVLKSMFVLFIKIGRYSMTSFLYVLVPLIVVSSDLVSIAS